MRYLALIVVLFLAVTSLVVSSACSDEETTGASTAPAPIDGAEPVNNSPAQAVLLFDIGLHIEPLGAVTSSLTGTAATSSTGTPGPDYNRPGLFDRHVQDILTLADIVERHQGKLTVQAQSPFTTVAISTNNTVLSDLAARGHEIGLHFHEDAHLGRNPDSLPSSTWCAVMNEEADLLKQASGAEDIRYWSGGNLYPGLLEAASCAGLDVNSDWKNPKEQQTATDLLGTNPWRPAGGSEGNNVSRFATHDAGGPVVYLPEGLYARNDYASMRRSESAGGDEAYFQFLKESLTNSLAQADPARVNVFHFTVHPGEFKGSPDHPFEVIDRFLTEVVDPLVASGQVQWATYSEMADAFTAWEQAHPDIDPRGA